MIHSSTVCAARWMSSVSTTRTEITAIVAIAVAEMIARTSSSRFGRSRWR